MFVLIVSEAEFSPSEHVIRQRCANETTCPTHHNVRATAERGGSGWCCVKKTRKRHAVREMKDDPSEPSCRGGFKLP
jgi:hypothetical protein